MDCLHALRCSLEEALQIKLLLGGKQFREDHSKQKKLKMKRFATYENIIFLPGIGWF